ncbi:MAG: hypothetical protein AB4426_22610 [Xenococcaceae cyanobacterium]
MSDSHRQENLPADNQSELEELAWTIDAYQGKFLLIFARCNYADLRSRLVQSLPELCQVEIRTLTLKPSDTILYNTIRTQLGSQTPDALMVLGLESVRHLEQMLASADQVREEFRKNFHFPLVFWVDDIVHKKLGESAPNLESWGTSTKFTIATDELIELLRQGADAIFAHALSTDIPSLFVSTAISSLDCREIEAAVGELQSRGQELEPVLKASLEFTLGQEAYLQNDFVTALEHYQRSLDFWQSNSPVPENVGAGLAARSGDKPITCQQNPPSFQLREGILLFHIGLCHFQQAEQSSVENTTHTQSRETLQGARNYFQQCLDTFEEANCPDLVVKFIQPLGEVLQRLEEWDDLQQLAQKALALDTQETQYLAPIQGFLAAVALKQSRGQDAKKAAQTALDLVAQTEVKQPQLQGRYLFLLAEAEHNLGQPQIAINHLERARDIGVEDEPQLYFQILERLRKLYLKQKQYFNAYRVKKQRQTVEQQYGFRAFIGANRIETKPQAKLLVAQTENQETVAPEIIAFGRKRDVKHLVERILRPDCKVIVIYGDSGVGKSTLVNGGLVPTLQGTAIGLQEVLPVSMRVYTDWMKELGKRLTEALEKKKIPLTKPLETEAAILEQLQHSEAENLRGVLIFDQFEEFFFVDTTKTRRNEFFEFLGKCLNILPLKVILSLRKDYLHYLLDIPGMEKINDDILSKNILYPIGDFSPEDAQAIIERLTKRSKFHLNDALIEQLVQDLTDKGKVRPIELQVVGAQLQEEKIQTLAEYQSSGTKKELVKRYLNSVVKDCGEENEQAANLVLYLLTDERGTRPLKTRAELEAELKVLAANFTVEASKLDLVLEILVESGLVFLVPETNADRYQLVHDYLVSFIREEQSLEIEKLIAQLNEEREQRQKLERSIQQVRKELVSVQAERERINQEVKQAQEQFREAEAARKEALSGTKLERRGRNALWQFEFLEFQKLEALLSAMHAGRDLQKLVKDGRPLPDYPAASPILALQTILDKIQERNQLQGHQDWVNSAQFSPDGQRLVTASFDQTARLWDAEGKELAVLQGHQSEVISAQFSPDGQRLVTASRDGTARLWNAEGKELAVLQGHQSPVNSAQFSPDGQRLVTASDDGTARLWDAEGKELAVLQGHQNRVNSAQFSPDGQRLVTASRDGTARLWDSEGKELAVLKGHQNWVNSAQFSPDGQRLVTASADQTARLWDAEGKELAVLQGHQDQVNSAQFSPNGQRLVTASDDRTARLWDAEGKELVVLQGHQDRVNSAQFSPDGQRLVTASDDRTARLWDAEGKELAVLRHQGRVYSAQFSPDGQRLITASDDRTARLWDAEGKELALLRHQGRVYSAPFSPDGQRLVTASDDLAARLWDAEGKELAVLRHQFWVYSAQFSPDGQRLVTASWDGTARLWDAEGKELALLQGHQNRVYSAQFSPDGQRLVTASDDRTARLWDAEGKELAVLQGHQDSVNSAQFSPDGQRLVTASDDLTVRLWDAEGKELAVLQGHQDSVNSAQFSPDGQRLATASADGTARLWRVETLDQLLDRGCDWLRDYLTNNPNVSEEDKALCPGIEEKN